MAAANMMDTARNLGVGLRICRVCCLCGRAGVHRMNLIPTGADGDASITSAGKCDARGWWSVRARNQASIPIGDYQPIGSTSLPIGMSSVTYLAFGSEL
jgi:hypothetical protein